MVPAQLSTLATAGHPCLKVTSDEKGHVELELSGNTWPLRFTKPWEDWQGLYVDALGLEVAKGQNGSFVRRSSSLAWPEEQDAVKQAVVALGPIRKDVKFEEGVADAKEFIQTLL